MLLLHDNARPHTAALTQATIHDLGYNQLRHPPYSPELASSDFWLFGELGKRTRGTCYNSIQHLSSAVGMAIADLQENFFARGIQQLPDRWNVCVKSGGENVKQLTAANDD